MQPNSGSLCVESYKPGDEHDIFALNLAEYGPTHVMITSDAFRWRYAQNPAGKAEITVVRDTATSHVVGFTWAVPVRMRLNGRDCTAVMTANQLIHPDYRSSLAYSMLIRRRLQMLRKLKVPFRFNFPIESLYQRTAAVEQLSSCLIPLLVKPVNPLNLGRAYLKKPILGTAAGLGAWAAAPFLFHGTAAPVIQDGWQVDCLEDFDERFDDLWERARDRHAVMAVRDRAFLSWRFAPVDSRRYQILAASLRGKLVGYLVLRCTDEICQIPIGLIMDMLLEPGPFGEEAGYLLLDEAWRIFKARRVSLAGGLALPHTQEYRSMRRMGYRDLGSRFSPRLFRVAYNCFGDFLPATEALKREDMFLTIADYEAH